LNETTIQQTILNRLTRSIESPITALWEKLRVLSTPQVPSQHRQPQQQEQQQTTCQSATVIKCTDSTHKIKIVKADLSNLNSNVKCQQQTNLAVTVENNTCSSNRVQSTELAQKK
jgi:hypothetical protein